jgi:hypothetical protein
MIYDSPVDFLRHAVVETAISRLHMKNRNAAPRRDNRRQSAVRIAQNQNFVGFVFF